MQQQLTKELLDATVGRTLNKLSRIGDMYKKGCLSDTECSREMTEAFCDGFWRFLRDNSLRLNIDEANYAGFSREYRSFTEGMDPAKPVDAPWLYCTAGGSEQKATPGDIALFFTLMRAFRLNPEYFEPMPSGIIDPGRTFVHRYRDASVYSIRFNCVDDGGLLAEHDPVGKSFRLKNDFGLEAAPTIKEDRRSCDRNGMDFDEMVYDTSEGVMALKADLLAEGGIEGYTAEEGRSNADILIRVSSGRIHSLAYWEDADDAAAFDEYPLWQDFFRWSDEHRIRQDAVLSALFDKYK